MNDHDMVVGYMGFVCERDSDMRSDVLNGRYPEVSLLLLEFTM